MAIIRQRYEIIPTPANKSGGRRESNRRLVGIILFVWRVFTKFRSLNKYFHALCP